MDLLAFEPGDMYFAEPLDARAEALIAQASEAYGSPEAEGYLRDAEQLAPVHLTVLVALYRYHFYRHQHGAALADAAQVLGVIGARLDLPEDWRDLTPEHVADAMGANAELIRLYLHALKGAGYLYLRLNEAERGLARLDKVAALDPKDRIGAKALADVARQALQNDAA